MSAAQVPPLPEVPSPESLGGGELGIALGSESGFALVPYNQNAMTRISVHDISGDSGRQQTNGNAQQGMKPHTIDLRVLNNAEVVAAGWQVQIGSTSLYSKGGDVHDVDVTFVTTPQINRQSITATIIAEFFDSATQHRMNQTINLTGQVMPYGLGMARMLTFPQEAEQFQVVKYEVLVTNDAVFPDVFTIEARADKPGFTVLAPGTVYVPPQESRTFFVSVQTPKGKIYELGENANINVKVRSQNSGAEFSVTGILKVEGFYISSYWLPLLVVGAISAGVVARENAQNRELRRLEKGRPRRVQPTPRQAVLLAELKRRDPEAYKAQKARLDALYKARRAAYRDERKSIVARDREERKQAALEYKEAKKRKKAQRAAEKAQAKLDRKAARKQRKLDKKAAKAQAKIDKKQAKVEAKQRKKLEKQLAKKRAALEKAKAKAAKAEAKRQQAEARAARKAERAAAKAAKASAKGRDGKP